MKYNLYFSLRVAICNGFITRFRKANGLIIDATSEIACDTTDKESNYLKDFPDTKLVGEYDDEVERLSHSNIISLRDYVIEKRIVITKYCFYSEKAEKEYGAKIYVKPDGNAVAVTGISYSPDAHHYKWDDTQYVGEYPLYTGEEWRCIFMRHPPNFTYEGKFPHLSDY